MSTLQMNTQPAVERRSADAELRVATVLAGEVSNDRIAKPICGPAPEQRATNRGRTFQREPAAFADFCLLTSNFYLVKAQGRP